MTSPTMDRRYGVNGSIAIKAPARLATTANITLNGLQSIDGVTTVAGDRVLVKDQTSAIENGVYVADSGDWTRDIDFDGNRDIVTGTLIHITAGSAGAGLWYEVTTANPITIGTSSIAFGLNGPPTTSDAVTYTPAGTGAVPTTVQTKLRESVSVKDFGAVGDGVTDDTASIQAALDWATARAKGAEIVFPKTESGYLCTDVLTIGDRTFLRGEGGLTSFLLWGAAYTGNGIEYIGPVDSYDTLYLNIRGIGLVCTNASNTGHAVLIAGAAYVYIDHNYIQGFKWGTTLDQVSHFDISSNYYTQQTKACVWLVNGNDREVGRARGYTNIGTISGNQFDMVSAAGRILLIDDGGNNHTVVGNNFNDGEDAARFAGVFGLTFENNEQEGSSASPVWFAATTETGGDYVYPCTGVSMRANTIGSATSYAVYIDALHDAEISANTLYGYSTQAIYFSGAAKDVANVRINENGKVLHTSARTGKPFFGADFDTAMSRRVDTSNQSGQSYIAALHAGGAQTVTPISMERINIGDYVWCINEDGTNGESVLVTDTSATQFTSTFASAKAANWLAYGQVPSLQTEGAWTPTLIGTSTAGTQTYTVQKGNWSKQGNKVHVTGQITISAKDAGIAGNVRIGGLPFKAKNETNRYCTVNFGWWGNFTFPANYTALNGYVNVNADYIEVRRAGSGQAVAPLAVSEMGATATVAFEATYYTY